MTRPTQEVLEEDLIYLQSCPHCNWYRPGRMARVSDGKDVGIVHPSKRIYRVWLKTKTSWSYLGHQIGRGPIT